MLSKVSQSQKDKYCDSTYIRYLEFKSIETESRMVLGAREEQTGRYYLMGTESQFCKMRSSEDGWQR